VRQLQNVIRVAVALLDEGETEILPAHLPEELFLSDSAASGEAARGTDQGAPRLAAEPAAAPVAGDGLALAFDRPGARRLDQLEVELIERVMREVGGNLSAAARLMGVSRNRLYRKLGRSGGSAAVDG
jgi:DNA-binding NtrC family response regulator